MDFTSLPSEFDAVDTAALLRANNWQEKYKMLMVWGNHLSVKPWLREEKYRVRGCDTSLWLFSFVRDNGIYFIVDGESRIIKGLAALLLSQVNGATKAHILGMDLPQLLRTFQLHNHLSPSRSNGFSALVARVVQSAEALDV